MTPGEAPAKVETAMAHTHTCPSCPADLNRYGCTVMACRDQREKPCLDCKQRGALPGPPR